MTVCKRKEIACNETPIFKAPNNIQKPYVDARLVYIYIMNIIMLTFVVLTA